MPLDAGRRFVNKHSFIVDGKPFRRDRGFTTCSELKESVGVIESRQGGSLYSAKSPGITTVPAVTLTRPATVAFPDLLAWFRQVSDGQFELSRKDGGTLGVGEPIGKNFKFDIDITNTERAFGPLQIFRLHDSWPSEVTMIDGLDNNAEERAMENIVLQVSWIELLEVKAGVNIASFVNTPFGDLSFRSGKGLNFSLPDFNDVIGGLK